METILNNSILLITLLCPVLCIIFRLNRVYQYDKYMFSLSQDQLIMVLLKNRGNK